MKIKKIAGVAMIATPFIGIFYLLGLLAGFKIVAIAFGIASFIVVMVVGGVTLLMEE